MEKAKQKGWYRAASPLSVGPGRHYYQPMGPPYPFDHAFQAEQTKVGGTCISWMQALDPEPPSRQGPNAKRIHPTIWYHRSVLVGSLDWGTSHTQIILDLGPFVKCTIWLADPLRTQGTDLELDNTDKMCYTRAIQSS